MPLAFCPVTDDELPIEVFGDYHRLCRAFERTGLGDVSGDRVSAKLYEQIHTIARNAAARRAQVLQGGKERFGGGTTHAPAASAAAEFTEIESEPSTLEDFASTNFRVPPYIVGQLASRAFSLSVSKFLRRKRERRRKSPAAFVLGSRADGRHLFYFEGRKSVFTWRPETELDQQHIAILTQYRGLKLEDFAFRASPEVPADMRLKESPALQHLLFFRYDVGKAAGQMRHAQRMAKSRDAKSRDAQRMAKWRANKKARTTEEGTPASSRTTNFVANQTPPSSRTAHTFDAEKMPPRKTDLASWYGCESYNAAMVHWLNLTGGKKGTQLDPALAVPSLDNVFYYRKRAWELWMARTLHREHITVADRPLSNLPPEEPTAGDSSTFLGKIGFEEAMEAWIQSLTGTTYPAPKRSHHERPGLRSARYSYVGRVFQILNPGYSMESRKMGRPRGSSVRASSAAPNTTRPSRSSVQASSAAPNTNPLFKWKGGAVNMSVDNPPPPLRKMNGGVSWYGRDHSKKQ